MNANPARPPKIALARSGGGPLGAIYEIGALCALEESLTGTDFTLPHLMLCLNPPQPARTRIGQAIANLQAAMDDLGEVVNPRQRVALAMA